MKIIKWEYVSSTLLMGRVKNATLGWMKIGGW